jgi:hypothetical protein
MRVLLLVLLVLLAGPSWAEQKFPITANGFDGAAFAKRYGLARSDFSARYEKGQLFLIVPDHIVLPAVPILDAPRVRRPEATVKADLAALPPAQLTQLRTAALTAAAASADPVVKLYATLLQLPGLTPADKTAVAQELLALLIKQDPAFATKLGVSVAGDQ